MFEHLQGKLIEMTRLATEQAPIGTAKKAARAAPVSSVRRSKLTASQIKKLGVTPSEGDNTDSAETSMVQEPAALVVSPPTVPEPEVDAVSLALLEASVDGLFERFDDFLNATTPTKDLATSKQRLRWTGGQAPLQKDLIPERVSLMTKKSRRCRVCTYNLIKPEAKAQVVKFSIHLCAVYGTTSHIRKRKFNTCFFFKHEKKKRFFVPNVTISKISTKESESTVQLRAINPLEMDVLIKVTSAEVYCSVVQNSLFICLFVFEQSKAKLPLQEILIGAYNEMGEYDDDDSEEAAKQLVPGVLEKKANHAIFEISVPSKASTRLSFAITYKGKPLSDQKLVGSMDLILVL